MKLEPADSYLFYPTLFCSLDSVDQIVKVCDHIPKKHPFLAQKPVIFIVEEDIQQFSAMFNVDDALGPLLVDDRIRFFLGPDCWTELKRYAAHHPGQCYTFRTPFDCDKYAPLIKQVLSVTTPPLEPYQPRPIHLNAGFRILIQKVQQSQVIGYAAEKMASAFKELGCEVQCHTEDSDFDRVTSNGLIGHINRFKPDLLFGIHNPFLSTAGKVPSFTWIQDPHLDFTGKLSETDTVAPVLHTLNHLYDRTGAKVVNMPFAVDPADYPFEQSNGFQYDISFVSNVDRGNLDPTLMKMLLPPAIEYFDSGKEAVDFNPFRVEGLVRDAMKGYFDVNLLEVMKYHIAFIERIAIRISIMRKIVALCRRHNLKLALFGRGWDEYDEFRNHSYGFCTNLQARAVFKSTRVNLHINPHTNMHQRVLESFSAGQFILFPELKHDQSITGVSQYLIQNHEYSSFKHVEDIMYHLEHDKHREEVAVNARDHILKSHTYLQRAEFVLDSLRSA